VVFVLFFYVKFLFFVYEFLLSGSMESSFSPAGDSLKHRSVSSDRLGEVSGRDIPQKKGFVIGNDAPEQVSDPHDRRRAIM
jgi:hypothetical protein